MPARPVINAQRIGLRLSTRWAFRDVDLVVYPGETTVVCGPADRRTLLLLTLAGELTPTTGRLELCGSVVPGHLEQSRTRLALAELPDHIADRASVTVAEAVREVLVLADLPSGHGLFDAAANLVGFTSNATTQVSELPPVESSLFAIALAVTTPVELLVMVDASDGLETTDRARIWTALRAVSRTGTAVVAGASDSPDGVRTVRLGEGWSRVG